MSDEKIILSVEQAKKLLPAGDTIHTFYSAPGILIGGDHERYELLGDIERYKCEIAGKHAVEMGHGLAIHTDLGPLFVETDPTELAKYCNPLTAP